MNCASNIITANFSGGKTHATTARVYQWSRGIELCITGADNLPQTFKAHFSVQKMGGVATTIVGIDERVTVPNVLFTIGKDIHVWLGASETEDDAEILYTVDIPVAPAPMPEYYDAEDTGVFDAVVEQVSGYAATATAAANSAGASATAAAGSASAAAAGASSAAGSAWAAEQARADAVTAKGQAETAAQTATEKALQTAQNASQAALDAGRAESAAERAESAETGAGAAKTAAKAAAQNAAASAATADEKATFAGQSATAAAGSASAAAQSAASIEGDVQIASQKASEAQTAAGQAVTAKDAAVTAQHGAETAATNAGQSASTATAKAAEAATSASNAAQSKTDAEAAATRAEQAAATLTVDDALSATSENPVQNKVIDAELTDVKTAIDALKIVDTASGAIASFSDGAAMPMESLTVEMSPIQDLHGQDSPYQAGGGKNVLPTYTADKTQNGVTLKVNNDYSITLNGTATATMTFTAPVGDFEWDGETPYWISGCPTGGDYNASYSLRVDGGNNSYSYPDTGNGAALRNYSSGQLPLSGVKLRFCIVIRSGTVCSNLTFKPMLNAGSSAEPFQPYSNICPISGRDAVTVTRTGVNVWDEQWEVGGISSADGSKYNDNNRIRSKNYISVKPSTQYYFSMPSTYSQFKVAFYKQDKTFLSYSNYKNSAFTTPANCYWLMISENATDYGTTYNHDISINYPSTDHDYHAYDGQSATIQLGTTVYGGTVDVTGGGTESTYGMVDLGTLNWTYSTNYSVFASDSIKNDIADRSVICTMYPRNPADASNSNVLKNGDKWVTVNKGANATGAFTVGSVFIKDLSYTDAATFKAAMSGVMLCYKRATPQTIETTLVEMTTLKGQNNVWSDADSVTVEYVADPKLYIARLTEPDVDMIADANITSGSYFMVGNTLYLATANIASGAAITPGVNCTRTNLAAALNAINA